MKYQENGELPDLVIGGVGTQKLHEMTLETYWACEEADYITGIFTDDLFIAAIESEFDAEVLNFVDKYDRHSSDRTNSYYDVIMATLSLAANPDTFVVSISCGHPLMMNSTTGFTYQCAQRWGLNVEVHPGVSAIASGMTMLGTDPQTAGFQLYDAGTCIRENKQLETESYAILWSLIYTPHNSNQDIGDSLVQYLLQFYEPTRQCYLYKAPLTPHSTGVVNEYEVQELNTGVIEKSGAQTLVIPPSKSHAEIMFEQYKQMLSPEQYNALLTGDIDESFTARSKASINEANETLAAVAESYNPGEYTTTPPETIQGIIEERTDMDVQEAYDTYAEAGSIVLNELPDEFIDLQSWKLNEAIDTSEAQEAVTLPDDNQQTPKSNPSSDDSPQSTNPKPDVNTDALFEEEPF